MKKGLSVAHDTILVYSKKSELVWHPPKLEYSEDYKKRFNQRDADGRRYTLDNMISPNPDRPNLDYEWNGVRRVWRVTKQKMAELEAEGKIAYTSSGVARYKRYLDELKGQPLTTLWKDIDPVNSQAAERQNYPTQKPEALLKRIIKTSTNQGDLVFDGFMGSGTTQAVAMKLGRRFIGADINLGAIQTTMKRLVQVARELQHKQTELPLRDTSISAQDDKEEKYYTGFEFYNVNHYDVFSNPAKARDLLIEALEIQPLPASHVFEGEKDGRMVKIMPVNRIATRKDLNDLLINLDLKQYQRRQQETPNMPVEKITLVCMGHEPDLKAHFEREMHAQHLTVDVEVVDILRDRQDLEFKRDAEARVVREGNELVIQAFYPMNLLQKLSLQQENVEDWRELVESVLVDWNYDGAVLQPAVLDIPEKDELVKGHYKIPEGAGTIRVKITDLLSESLEVEV